MTDQDPKTSRKAESIAAGILLIALGLLVRPEVVGYTLTPDEELSDAKKILAVQACEGFAILLGILTVLRGRLPFVGKRATDPIVVLLFALVCVAVYGNLLTARILD